MKKKTKATITTPSKGSEVIHVFQTDGLTQIHSPHGWSAKHVEVRTREEYKLFMDLLELGNKEDK